MGSGISIVQGSSLFRGPPFNQFLVLLAHAPTTFKMWLCLKGGLHFQGKTTMRPALDGLLGHPVGCSDAVPDLLECCVVKVPKWFFNNLLGDDLPINALRSEFFICRFV